MERRTLKRDIAVVRVLLDEIDRGEDIDDGIAAQLVNEVERVFATSPKPRLAKCALDDTRSCDEPPSVTSLPSATRTCSG